MFVDVSHVATPLAGCVQSEVMQQPLTGMHVEPHCLYPALQTKPHWPLLLQVAIVALAGTGHGVHDVPHEFTLVLSKQLPLHSCVPLGQLPLHAMLVGIHAPKHSFWPFGHEPPQAVPSQVAVPPVGAVHGVQDILQLPALVELKHCPAQM